VFGHGENFVFPGLKINFSAGYKAKAAPYGISYFYSIILGYCHCCRRHLPRRVGETLCDFSDRGVSCVILII
jgi:hypothetical protein